MRGSSIARLIILMAYLFLFLIGAATLLAGCNSGGGTSPQQMEDKTKEETQEKPQIAENAEAVEEEGRNGNTPNNVPTEDATERRGNGAASDTASEENIYRNTEFWFRTNLPEGYSVEVLPDENLFGNLRKRIRFNGPDEKYILMEVWEKSNPLISFTNWIRSGFPGTAPRARVSSYSFETTAGYGAYLYTMNELGEEPFYHVIVFPPESPWAFLLYDEQNGKEHAPGDEPSGDLRFLIDNLHS